VGALIRRFRLRAALVVVAILFLHDPAAAVEVRRVVSAGGIEAWLVEDHTNPIVALRFAFRGGGALDPEGKEGLADMVSGLLDEGAGELDSQAFQKRLEDLSITLSFDAGRDSFGGRLRTLTQNQDEAVDLLRMALTVPRFDDEPVQRVRNQILANLRRQAEEPGVIARRALFKEMFPGHAYGRPTEGTPESINAIETGDLRAFVNRRIARNNLVVGAVGDISPNDLARVVDNVFGGLPAEAAEWNLPDVQPHAASGAAVIEKPIPQSAIVFGQRGVKRDDPDYYAAYVLNHILGGGGFTSRLYRQVREKRGLAYSVYSALLPMDEAGIIFGGAGTRNDRVVETIDVVKEEWRRMAAEGPTVDELADAKKYLTGSFSLQFSSSDRIASILLSIQLDRLGIDYLDRRNGLIEAVTLDDVKRIAQTLLDPDHLRFVVVGQPQGLPAGG